MGAATTTTNNTVANGPYAPQQPYLNAGLQDAQGVLAQRTAAGPYTGELYAGMNGTQAGTANQASNFALGVGGNNANALAQTSQGLLPSAQGYANNASGMASGGLSQTANSGDMNTLNQYAQGGGVSGQNNALTGAIGQSGVMGSGALGQAQGVLGQVAQTGLQNNTGNTINNASQYANNGYLNNQISAQNAINNQTLNEQTLPGLDRQASMSGNLNSSRAGAANAMAREGTALVNAQTDASMRSSAYNNGLTLSAQQQEAGLNSANSAANNMQSGGLGAASLASQNNQFNTTSQLGAANSALSSGLGYGTLNNQTQLSANSQLGTAGALGIQAANQSGISAAQNLALGSTAGGAYQTNQQNTDQAALTQYNQVHGGFNQAALNDYWNTVKTPLGNTGTTNTTVTAPSSTAGQIAGLGLGAASLFAPGAGGAISTAANIGSGLSSAYNTISGWF